MTTVTNKRLAQGAAQAAALATGKDKDPFKPWPTIGEPISLNSHGGNMRFELSPPNGKYTESVVIRLTSPKGKESFTTIQFPQFCEMASFFRDDDLLSDLMDVVERCSLPRGRGVVETSAAGPASSVMADAPWNKDKAVMPGLNRNKVDSLQAWLTAAGAPDAAVETNRKTLQGYVNWMISSTGLFNQDGSRK